MQRPDLSPKISFNIVYVSEAVSGFMIPEKKRCPKKFYAKIWPGGMAMAGGFLDSSAGNPYLSPGPTLSVAS
jgi:hypothetical protein